MRILERKKWCYIFDCGQCGSKLQAEAADVQMGYFDSDWTERGSPKCYVNCSVCGQKKIVPGSKITDKILNLARQKAV